LCNVEPRHANPTAHRLTSKCRRAHPKYPHKFIKQTLSGGGIEQQITSTCLVQCCTPAREPYSAWIDFKMQMCTKVRTTSAKNYHCLSDIINRHDQAVSSRKNHLKYRWETSFFLLSRADNCNSPDQSFKYPSMRQTKMS
jgi:hypothetical protein